MTEAISLSSRKKKHFVLLWSTLSHLICVGISFLLTPFLISKLGEEAYAYYPAALEVAAAFSLAAGLFHGTACRTVAVEDAGGSFEEANKTFSTVFFADLFLSLLLLVPMGILIAFGEKWLGFPAAAVDEFRIFYGLLLCDVPVRSVFTVFDASFDIANRPDIKSGVALAVALVKGGFIAFFYCGLFPFSLIGVAAAILISDLVGTILKILMSRFLAPRLSLSIRDFSFKRLGRVFSSGIWYSVYELGGYLSVGALLVVAGKMLGTESIFAYSVALTVSRFLVGLLSTLSGVFLPATLKQYALSDTEELRNDLRQNVRLSSFAALLAVSLGIGFSPIFFRLWFGMSDVREICIMSALTVLPMLAVSCSLPIYNLAIAFDKLKNLALIRLGVALTALGGAVVLMKFTSLGAYGAAGIGLVSRLLFDALFMPLFARKLLGGTLKEIFEPTLRAHLACLLSVGIIYAIQLVFPLYGWGELAIMSLLCTGAVGIIGFLMLFGKPRTYFSGLA